MLGKTVFFFPSILNTKYTLFVFQNNKTADAKSAYTIVDVLFRLINYIIMNEKSITKDDTILALVLTDYANVLKILEVTRKCNQF